MAIFLLLSFLERHIYVHIILMQDTLFTPIFEFITCSTVSSLLRFRH